MNKEDEFTLKEWLFETWKKTRRHEFFLAGCVVGKVPDAYGLAKRYGIKSKIAREFFERLGIPGVILRDRDRFTIFNCLERWARDNDVPPKIAKILHYAKDEKILVFMSAYCTVEITGNKDVTLFEEDMPKEDEFERWYKKLLSALEEEQKQTFGYRRELFVRVVSRTQTARAYEKMLRNYYKFKALIKMGELSPESLPSLNRTINHYYAEDIENAKTADEMFALWKMMCAGLLDIKEILDEVGKRIGSESSSALYWRQDWKLEHFFDFVRLWEECRKSELKQLEGKANSAGVDLKKMNAQRS